MLAWSAAQATEITTTAIDLEFLPNVTNVERGIQNLECVARDAQSTHDSHELRHMTLSLSRGRTRWKHGEDCRNVLIRRQVEGNESC